MPFFQKKKIEMDFDAAWSTPTVPVSAPPVSALKTKEDGGAAEHDDIMEFLREMDRRRTTEARIQIVVLGILGVIILHRIETAKSK